MIARMPGFAELTMASCCGPAGLDQTDAVQQRYGAAAAEREACLCTPVAFDAALLEVIPAEVVERDYGCGDPPAGCSQVTPCSIWAAAAARTPSSVPRW